MRIRDAVSDRPLAQPRRIEVGDASDSPASQAQARALPSRRHMPFKWSRPPGWSTVRGQTRPSGPARAGRRSPSCRQVCSLTGQARRTATRTLRAGALAGASACGCSRRTQGPGLGPDSGRAVHGQGGELVRPFFAPLCTRPGPSRTLFP